MALDAVAAATAAAGGPRTVRVYRWEPATLSLGYRTDPEVVDWAFCEREGIDVVRRPTGGGAIYHDTDGDVSYSVIAPTEELPDDLMATYELLCEPLLTACERLGVPARFADDPLPALYEPACYLRAVDPAHDVVVGDRKLSGNAQYRRRESVVQHGSLTYRTPPDRSLGCFRSPGITPETFDDRVTDVARESGSGASRAETVAALEDALAEWADAETREWTDAELERARELAARKFDTEAWTRDREDPTG